jgi:murein endopeptidase
VPIEVEPGCAEGGDYPTCRWRVADSEDAGHIYGIWRNTAYWHRSGSPALVSTVLAAAAAYADSYPGEKLVIGDLDAPGNRHTSHDTGRDVDLYLPDAMIATNPGRGDYPSNYLYRSNLERRMMRGRVESLAKILARCTDGEVRIFYNDPAVNERVDHWFRDRRLRSPFGTPIRAHNELHRFHFHVTLGDEAPALPSDASFRPADPSDLVPPREPR